MTEPTNPRDELWDRLTDLALEETLGGRRPGEQHLSQPQEKLPMRTTLWRWRTLSLAASLLLVGFFLGCLAVLAYQAGQPGRDVARQAESTTPADGTQRGNFDFHIGEDRDKPLEMSGKDMPTEKGNGVGSAERPSSNTPHSAVEPLNRTTGGESGTQSKRVTGSPFGAAEGDQRADKPGISSHPVNDPYRVEKPDYSRDSGRLPSPRPTSAAGHNNGWQLGREKSLPLGDRHQPEELPELAARLPAAGEGIQGQPGKRSGGRNDGEGKPGNGRAGDGKSGDGKSGNGEFSYGVILSIDAAERHRRQMEQLADEKDTKAVSKRLAEDSTRVRKYLESVKKVVQSESAGEDKITKSMREVERRVSSIPPGKKIEDPETIQELHDLVKEVDHLERQKAIAAEEAAARRDAAVWAEMARRLRAEHKDAGDVDAAFVARAFIDVSGELPPLEKIKEFVERARDGRGLGPGQGGDRYLPIHENRFLGVPNHPLSTFSIDVDTASYSKVRRIVYQHKELPPPDAVRLEEFVNYFRYGYAAPGPKDKEPFAVHAEVAACPWTPKHKLLRIGLKGRDLKNEDRPASNLVFLIDVSGSMDQPDKLPLVKKGLKTLVSKLRESDRVAIVTYAGSAGQVLASTPGSEKAKITAVLDELTPQGSTNGAQGIHLAYDIAAAHKIAGGTNRVILATDGDFNVGTTSDAELVRLVETKSKAGIFLTALGFGIGNHNDQMLEQIADKGNGNYYYVDTELEARKVFSDDLTGTLVTIAKDVKIQVEFNPARVAAYRLLGYENRLLRTEDFKDDTKDAGEIGAGHTVTALYEIVPAGTPVPSEPTELKYQKPAELTPAAKSGELLTVHLRYKLPDADKSVPLEVAVPDSDTAFGKASGDFQFAAAVASFGMLLRNSQYRGSASYDNVLELAKAGLKDDEFGYRAEFVDLVTRAKAIAPPIPAPEKKDPPAKDAERKEPGN